MNSERKTTKDQSPLDILTEGMFGRLFSKHLTLSPRLNDVYELALAFYESRILSDEEIVRNGAYFVRVGDALTHHYLMCTGDPLLLPMHSSSRLKSFFQKNQFRTGYATHGLFPYRGKFHPQMIKGLINIMGLKPGDTILDPMMGSGTVPVEASLMGIKSIGIDASPFCRFMAQVKYQAITLPESPMNLVLNHAKEIHEICSGIANNPQKKSLSGIRTSTAAFSDATMEIFFDLTQTRNPNIIDFLLLAYLDSAGYSERSNRKSPLKQFQAILERYIFAVKKIQYVLKGLESKLAETHLLEGDARNMSLENNSVDGILFSPPYSFAIDYLANDSFHLKFIGQDIDQLRKKMVGLRGKTIKEEYHLYIEDMTQIFAECARVLKPDRFCTLIVGTNDNQLSKALGIPREQVTGLDHILTDLAASHGLSMIRKLHRQISGIANTMRNEYIVFLTKKM